MYRFLIVEDNFLMRNMLAQTLRSSFPGSKIREAVNGKQAMETAEQTPMDLILMDIGLPDANGLDLTRKIKSRMPATRVVLVTMYDGPEYREKAMENGADRFLSKRTNSSNDIAQAVKDLIENGSS